MLSHSTHSKIAQRLLLQFQAQWVSNQSGVTPKQFYYDVVFSLEDIVLDVLFNLIRPINGNKNPKVKTDLHHVSAQPRKNYVLRSPQHICFVGMKQSSKPLPITIMETASQWIHPNVFRMLEF